VQEIRADTWDADLDALSVSLTPDHDKWPTIDAAPAPNDEQRRARAELGLDPDRPVLASGHQPVIYHPGIVAKLVALDAWTSRAGAQALWVVPDMDAVDPGVVRIPEPSDDDLRAAEFVIGSDQREGPAATMPPIERAGDLPAAVRPLGERIEAYATEGSRARQFTHAVLDDLCEALGLKRPVVVFASDLAATVASGSLIDLVRNDPDGAVRAYNDAIDDNENTGVRPLAIDRRRVELPLWSLAPGRRDPVVIERGGAIPEGDLAPRGLLMTAIVRRSLCDAFIHGTGGMRYDRVTESWIARWLGAELAPMVGASATLRLDLPLPPAFTDPDRAAWEAHHARHDPEMLDEHALARRKDELVRAIDEAKERGEDPGALFDRLQGVLGRTRDAHRPELDALRERARWAERFRDARAVARDRTWGYPLYGLKALVALRDAVRAAMG